RLPSFPTRRSPDLPDRLRGDEIPLSAQIVGIADVYDALTSTRPYRPALSRERALTEMERCRGWWSEAVCTAFRKSLADPRGPTAESSADPCSVRRTRS